MAGFDVAHIGAAGGDITDDWHIGLKVPPSRYRRVGGAFGRRRVTPAVQALETWELLSGTTLLWGAGVSLPAPSGGASAVAQNGTVVVAGGLTTGSARAVLQGTLTSSTWATLTRSINTGRVGAGIAALTNGLLLFGGGTGSSGTNATSNAYLYEISGASSRTVASLHTPRKQLASAAAVSMPRCSR